MKLTTVLLFAFLMSSCGSKFDSKLLLGKWVTEKWVNKTDNQPIDAKMIFEFSSEGKYLMSIGNRTEQGKYWVFGEFLHTVEEGRSEKKVKIVSLTSDTMTIEMNRFGTIEEVDLRKE